MLIVTAMNVHGAVGIANSTRKENVYQVYHFVTWSHSVLSVLTYDRNYNDDSMIATASAGEDTHKRQWLAPCDSNQTPGKNLAFRIHHSFQPRKTQGLSLGSHEISATLRGASSRPRGVNPKTGQRFCSLWEHPEAAVCQCTHHQMYP